MRWVMRGGLAVGAVGAMARVAWGGETTVRREVRVKRALREEPEEPVVGRRPPPLLSPEERMERVRAPRGRVDWRSASAVGAGALLVLAVVLARMRRTARRRLGGWRGNERPTASGPAAPDEQLLPRRLRTGLGTWQDGWPAAREAGAARPAALRVARALR